MLELSKTIMSKIENLITKYSFAHSKKSILIIALFELARQHHQSILILIENKNINSAASLLRPLVEAHYRAQWVQNIASDNEIEKIVDGSKNFKTLRPISEKLDKKYQVKSFSKDLDTLNDFTHGGIQQIFRMIENKTIKSNYSKRDVNFILETSNKNLCFFLHSIGVYLNDEKLMQEGSKLIVNFDQKCKVNM